MDKEHKEPSPNVELPYHGALAEHRDDADEINWPRQNLSKSNAPQEQSRALPDGAVSMPAGNDRVAIRSEWEKFYRTMDELPTDVASIPRPSPDDESWYREMEVKQLRHTIVEAARRYHELTGEKFVLPPECG